MENTEAMSEYNLKSIRKKFSENGVFYTDEALAKLLKSYMPEDLTEVYDPTCGCGNLLAVFGDCVHKYGQELDPEQAKEASERLANSHIVAGDTLKNPAFIDRRFRGIVANYPFSVKWEPNENDGRFSVAPCTAPPSKADWAFMLHILYMLADDGVAATLNFPGILYRGQREQKIRQWFVESGYIHEVVRIEKDHFADTSIETALVLIRKKPTDAVRFADNETGKEHIAHIDEIRKANFILTPSHYIPAEETEKPDVDPCALETSARKIALRRIEAEIKISLAVANIEGWDTGDFIEDIISLANSYRKQPSLFPLFP